MSPRTLAVRALPLGLAALALTAWLQNCTGPRPEVDHIHLQAPRHAGDPYVLEARVRNTGPGHGEVQVLLALRAAGSGQMVQTTEQIALDGGENVLIRAELVAPPATYVPEVTAQFPPG